MSPNAGLTKPPVFVIVCRLISLPHSAGKENRIVRERQRELRRRRKRKEETLRARRKAARTDAAAQKAK